MIGEDLLKILENKPELKNFDIKYTILYLLKKNLITPATIIDEYSNMLNEEIDKYKCQYNEACLCTDLILNGNDKQRVWAEKRAAFNSSNANIKYTHNLSEEDIEESAKFFESLYGFDPRIS